MDSTWPCFWVQERKQNYLSSFILKTLLNTFNCVDIVCLMSELAMPPYAVCVGLQEVECRCQLLALGIRVEKNLFITERTATHIIFIVWNHKDYWFTSFFTFPDESSPMIAIKHNSNSYFFLKFMAFKDTLQA
jgi:hypothetical protein